jgi:hypothetical protein
MISGAVSRRAGATVKGGSGGCPDHTNQGGGDAGGAVEAILRAVMRAWEFSIFSGHVFPSGTDRAGREPPSRGKGGRPVPGPDRGSTDRENYPADRDRRAKGNPARTDHGGGKGIAGVRPKQGAFDRVLLAAIYACIRRSTDSEKRGVEPIVLPPRMAEFLTNHPEFLNSPRRLRNTAFYKWLNDTELR